MMNISEIRKEVTPIAQFYGVKRLYLFGSYANDTADRISGLGLLVEKGKPMSLLQLSGMRQMVQDAVNLPVDLVTTMGIEESFKEVIAGTEILIYEQ